MSKQSCIEQYLKFGYRLFQLNGKKPLYKGWQNTKQNPFTSAADFPKNFGVCLQNDDLVIDVDEGEKKDGSIKRGKQSFKRLVKGIKCSFGSTCIIKTGSGGFHIYLKKPTELKIKELWSEYPDLEFKSKGRFVVGAECVHPVTNKIYKIVQGDLSSVQTAPTALLDLIKFEPIDFTKIDGLKSYVDDVQSIARTKAYLEHAKGAIEGQSGDSDTYVVACRCRSFGLSPQCTLDLMLSIWNKKCQPEWDPEALKTKVYNAYSYDTHPLGSRSPEIDFKNVPTKKTYIWDGKQNKDGSRTATLLNTVNFLDINENLNGLFKFNLFTEDVEFTRDPIWLSVGEKVVPWNDNDNTDCKFVLSSQNKIQPGTPILDEAVYIMAKQKPVHPIRDYLNGLKWDKKGRVGNWLQTYCGVTSDLYSQTIGTKVLVAAVARIFDPGVKFDTVLVIEGAQGVGKSRLLAVLGGEWYGDLHLDPHNKDTVAAMRNKWIIEISEMEMLKRTDINALKSFLSRNVDRVRLSHRKNAKDYPRQCIFIGTINPEQDSGYLRDNTGNRRFWPVTVPKRYMIKVEKMEKDRDQIWAEAMHLYKTGNISLHIEDEATSLLALQEAELRRPKDTWLEPISEWLNKPDENGKIKMHTTSIEVFEDCLSGVKIYFKRPEAIRISQIMVGELGWEKGSFYVKGKGSTTGYNRPKNDMGLL